MIEWIRTSRLSIKNSLCNRTAQLCAALAAGGGVARLRQKALSRVEKSTGHEKTAWLDVFAFLGKVGGWKCTCGCRPHFPQEFAGGGMHLWLQAASQEPDASFLSRGAKST